MVHAKIFRASSICYQHLLRIPLLLLLAYPATAFTTRQAQPFEKTTQMAIMRGFYSDPQVPLDEENTRMVIGVKCQESNIYVQDKMIAHLLPTQEIDQQLQVEVDLGPLIIPYLMEELPEKMIRGRTVLEVGASSTALTALLALEASSVIVCHPDAERLRILEHARQRLNSDLLQSTQGEFYLRK